MKSCSTIWYRIARCFYAKSPLTGHSFNNLKGKQVEANFLRNLLLDFLMRSHTAVVLRSQWKVYLFRTVYHLDSLHPIDPFPFQRCVIYSLFLETALMIPWCFLPASTQTCPTTESNTHVSNYYLMCFSAYIYVVVNLCKELRDKPVC